MKTLFLMMAAVTIGLLFLSSVPKSQANSAMQNANQTTNWEDYKQILFVDQSLEEIAKLNKEPGNPFIRAHEFVKSGKAVEAKKVLRQVLADPASEVRTKLWVWNALRQLGQKPPLNVANEVHGIVMEVPVDGGGGPADHWVDTLAAYSDGRARYVNGKGRAIIWETPEERRIGSLVGNFIKAARPLVAKAPVFSKHQPASSDLVRISLLTYGGLHIIEAKQSDLTERHRMSPAYGAGTQLFLALLDDYEKSKQKP